MENDAGARLGNRFLDRWRVRQGRGPREDKRERRTLAGFRCHFDLRIEKVCNAFDDREAKAKPAITVGPLPLDAEELLENLRKLILGDARPAVLYRDPDAVFLLVRNQPDEPLLRIADRIVDEIPQ